MSRVRDILLRARYTLADPDGEKWNDAQLLSYLDEGQKDLCRRAKLLRSYVEFDVLEGQNVYEMPEDFLLLDMASLNERALRLSGHAEVEAKDPSWTTREGSPTTVIYDKQMRGKIKLYPTPIRSGRWLTRTVPVRIEDESARIKQNFGVVAGVKFPSEIRQDFGVATSIKALWQFSEPGDTPSVIEADYKFNSDFGVVTKASLILNTKFEASLYGIITAIEGASSPDPYGVLTDIKGSDYAAIRFSDSFGVGTNLTLTENYGYYTNFYNTGLVTDVCGAKVSDYGIINSVSPLEGTKIVFNGDFGLNTGLTLSQDVLKVYYLRKPKTIESLDDELETDTSFDTALKFYVTSCALTSSIDAGNRQFGAEEKARYLELAQFAEKDDSKDFTRSSKVWYSEYNGGI